MTRDALDDLLTLDRGATDAVRWGGRRLTYAQLDAAVDRLARLLVTWGATGAHVAVHGPLSPAYLVGLLATLRVHAVPVPVDAGMTPSQYGWTGRVTRPAVVVSSDVSSLAQHLDVPAGTAEVVLDAADGHLVTVTAPARPDAPWRHRDPDAGYVISTSGSTGEPKAVVGSRRGLHDFLTWFVDEFRLGADDSVAAVTRVTFDPSLRELLAVLSVGGRVDLPAVDAQLDPAELADHLATSGASLVFLVPSLARRVGARLEQGSQTLGTLRCAFFAGEVLSRRVVEQWAKLAPGAELVNLYGLTEGTLAQVVRRDVGSSGTRGTEQDGVPVGRPRPGVTVGLSGVDADGCGEVVLTGRSPALGLLRDTTRVTDPRELVVDPLPPDLRTGDVGRWDADGQLVVVGRLGNDLKVAGRRVTYDRFVDAVEALAGVEQCVVVDRDGPHAFVVLPADDRAASRTEIGAAAAARALGVPVPTIHVRPTLPLLRSGKVDRAALARSVGEPRVAVDEADGDAVTVIETILDMLALGRTADPATSFVDAGVTSIDMMDLAAHLSARYGRDLSVQDCFACRDIAGLARLVDGTAARTDHGEPPVRATVPPTGPDHPLSTRQVAYAATCMADGNANWCNISREIQVGSCTDLTDLTTALGRVVARHDALRMSLHPEGSLLRHTVAPDVGRVVREHVAAASAGPDRQVVQLARVAAVAELLDPTVAPPIRAVLVRGRSSSSVLLVAHHLLVDGLSMDLVARELRAELAGEELTDAPDPTAFRAYCRATRRPDQPDPAQRAYWRDLLRGVQQVTLPEAVGPGATLGRLVSRPFGLTGSRAAHQVAGRLGTSVFPVVLTAFAEAVTQTFGTVPVPVVVPVQVREGTPTGVVGMFTSQVVVRPAASGSFEHRIGGLVGQLDHGVAASGWEFDQRVDELGLSGSDAFPVSTVLFNQHPLPRGRRPRDLGRWEPRDLGRGLRYQLQGELQMSGAEMALSYYYRQGISMQGTGPIDVVHERLVRAIVAAAR